MNSTKIDPRFISKSNPRVGLIALASDFTIEKDFINVIKDKKIAIPGDSVVITAGVPFGNAGSTNLLRIAKIIDDKNLS